MLVFVFSPAVFLVQEFLCLGLVVYNIIKGIETLHAVDVFVEQTILENTTGWVCLKWTLAEFLVNVFVHAKVVHVNPLYWWTNELCTVVRTSEHPLDTVLYSIVIKGCENCVILRSIATADS